VAPFIYRFMRDLRIDDHAGLAQAASYGDVLPVLVIDRALEARLTRSPRRAAFFCDAVAALDAALRERGSHLIVRRGAQGAALKNIARACGAGGAAWSASYDGAGMHADERLQSELEEAGLRAAIVHDAPAVAPDETAAARPSGGDDGYRAFAPYFAVWLERPLHSYDVPLLVRFAASDLQSEPLPQPHDFGALERRVEFANPRALVEKFIEESAVQYALAVNTPGDDRTSHLSPHVSFGTVSARTVVRLVRKRLDDPFLLSEERFSLRLFLRSIAQRDFFLQLGHFHPQTDDVALQDRMRAFAFARNHAALDAWRGGRTGFALVDAGIRQLHETGWMHPRVRTIAASFLAFDLGVDWRVGRDDWSQWLIEDDPAIASGNWQWIAGVGADMAQYPRIYNPNKAGRRFDPRGVYVRRWIPELADRATWSWSAREADAQLTLSLFGSDDAYPRPVLDHETAARAFLEKYAKYIGTLPRG
jgi:deoxyribodipyrimidine photo-lyase